MRKPAIASLLLFASLLTAVLSGCNGMNGGGAPEIVLYSDLPKADLEPIVQAFTAETKLKVILVSPTDEEMKKGIGLSQRVREDLSDNKVDLYLAANPLYVEKLAADDSTLESRKDVRTIKIDANFRHPLDRWTGLLNRTRVLLYNNKAMKGKTLPNSIAALARAEYKGRIVMADPRTNFDSQYHLLLYFAAYGDREGTAFLTRLRSNGLQLASNEADAAQAIADGKADWGVVDSDAAALAIQSGKPVDFVLPDQAPASTSNALGRLAGGTSVASLGAPALTTPLVLIKNRPHPLDSAKLYDYFISPQVAFQMLQKFPLYLSTRASASTEPVGKSDGMITNSQNIKFAIPTPDEVSKARPAFNLALPLIGTS